MTRIRKFLTLTGRERELFLEAAFWMSIFRAAILILPFKMIARRLGRHMCESNITFVDAEARKEVIAVSRALQTMARNLPWKCTCLVQGAAGKRMLGLRRIPATLYLGSAKDDRQKLIAHAWLRSADVVVTGSAEKDRFTVVSFFS